MGFASGDGSLRGDEGSSGAEDGGFGGWGDGPNEHGTEKGDERGDRDFGGTGSGGGSGSNQSARRAVDYSDPDDSRSFLGRIRDLFSGDDDSGEMTDAEGNVVAESFTIEPPGEIQTVDLGETTDYETINEDNPYESYARSVIDQGLVGDEQEEKDLTKQISDAGRASQGLDVASTLAGTFAGPIGTVPGLAYDAVTAIQDDPIQQAGQALYEGGRVTAPGVSTAINAAFGGLAGGAYDIANDAFGGSRDLGAFEAAAGVEREPQERRANVGFGNDNNRGVSDTAESLVQPPATLANTFSQSSLGTNVYSDFLENFFKQG